MDIKDALIRSKELIDETNIDKELRGVAFEKAVEYFLVAGEGARRGAPSPHGAVLPRQRGSGPENAEPLPTLASRTEIDERMLREVFNVDEEGKLEVVVPTTDLDRSKAGGTKQLALLFAGGKQLSGLEDWTAFDSIREVCEYYNKYDMPNFSKAVKSLGDFFSFRGKGQGQEVRLKRPGETAFVELVRDLTEE